MSVQSWPNLHALVDPLLGTPYAECDCWRLLHTLYQQGFGLDLANDPSLLSSQFQELWFQGDARCPLALVQPWDCLVLSIKGLVGDHCGLVLDEALFVHPRKRAGVVKEPIRRWQEKLLQVVRPRELL